MKKISKNAKKNFIWNTIGSTLNAAISLFFMIAVTRINGSDKAGIFTFAFSTSCLLQVIGLYSGRTYQVTERDERLSDTDFIYNKLFSCLLMLIASILFIVIKGYNTYKTLVIIMLVIYKVVEAFSETLYAIIQKNDELYKVGISLFFKGIISTILFIVIDLLTHSIILSILSIIFTYLIIIIFYDLNNVKKTKFQKLKFNKYNVWLIFKMGIWTFLLTMLTQYVINAPKYAIDNYLNNNSQTIYGIIVMPATLIILCGQFLIHPFLNRLSNHLKKKEFKEFNNIIFKLVSSILLLGLIIVIISYFIGIPFLEFVYGLELKTYQNDLIIILIGATLFGISFILSNALIALRNTFSQAVIFGISSLLALIFSNILVKKYQLLGASLTYLLTMLILTLMFLCYYIYQKRRKLK